jgi:hypothetical protein
MNPGTSFVLRTMSNTISKQSQAISSSLSPRCYPAIAEHKNGLGPDADVIALDSGISSFLKTRLAGVIVSALPHPQGILLLRATKANTI